MNKKRVVVAMSGGVDSSVAAALLKKANYDVIGITMQILPLKKESTSGCSSLEAIEDAKKVSAKLGISHYVLDFRNIFTEKVITSFYQEYSLGRTPNPCIWCNQYVKFGALLKKAKELGANLLATGHHARIKRSSYGYQLWKGIDRSKDQSYFLYTLGGQDLPFILFPIGNYHKAEVRRIATELDLPTANINESQDICFVSDSNYRVFISKKISCPSYPRRIFGGSF